MIGRRKRQPVAPDQDAVVSRVLCVAVVAMLGAIADGVEQGEMDEAQAGKYLAESHRWLIREHLADVLSVRERALIAKAIADWTREEAIDAEWRNESLGVLLWALGVFGEMPAPETRFERLPQLVPLLAPTAGFRSAARLRPAEEIGRARGLAELWHWRARTRELQEGEAPEVKGHDLDAIARQAAALAHGQGSIPAPIDGDFPAHGKAFRALEAEEYADLRSSSVERHYALNWLCGYSADWDRVPTGT